MDFDEDPPRICRKCGKRYREADIIAFTRHHQGQCVVDDLRADLARVTGELALMSDNLVRVTQERYTERAKLAAAESLIEKLDAQLTPLIDAREDWIAKEARLLDKLAELEMENMDLHANHMDHPDGPRCACGLPSAHESGSCRRCAKLAEAEARIASALIIVDGMESHAEDLVDLNRGDAGPVSRALDKYTALLCAALGRGTPDTNPGTSLDETGTKLKAKLAEAEARASGYGAALERIEHSMCKTRARMHPCLFGGTACNVARAALGRGHG